MGRIVAGSTPHNSTAMPTLTRPMAAKKVPKKDTRSSQEIEDSRRHKFQLNLRISDLARDLLGNIAEKHGMNLTHALEYSIRQTARAEGVYTTRTKDRQ